MDGMDMYMHWPRKPFFDTYWVEISLRLMAVTKAKER